jgi:hypothetical protein
MMQQVVVSQQTGYARNASESAYPNLWRGLVGWWLPSVNPRGGNRLFDLSPFRNHGTLTNMTNDDWVVSQGVGALDFDGVNDYVNCGTSVRGSSRLTVSVWVQSSSPVNLQRIFSNEPDDYTTAFTIYLNSGNWFFFTSATSPDAFAQASLGTTAQINTGQWVHLCATYNGSVINTYRNGVFVATASWTRGISAFQGTTVLGATFYQGNFTGYFSGQIDDARIYSRALTPPEIRQLASKRGIGLQRTQPRRIPEEIAAGVANPVLFYNHYTNQGFF